MRELTDSEMVEVSGAGVLADVGRIVKDENFGRDFGDAIISVYEGLVSATSHVIGRVAGDLHSSYYE